MMRTGLISMAALGGAVLWSSIACADIQHTVGKGHTIEAIANRYRVSAKSIIVANRLKDVKRLKIGDVLTIPNVNPPQRAKSDKDGKGKEKDGKTKPGAKMKDAKEKDAKAAARSFAAKPKTPGVVHVKRLASQEEVDLRISDKRGRIAPVALKAMAKIMRFPNGASHPIEPRLVSLLGIVSNHFGSRKIEIISGFRPYKPTQYTKHSNHNHGKAIDFRVIGVPNEVVRDFCRTLKNVGCGYYPNSMFIHMDVRDSSAFWIDYSKPGEPPRYNAANVEADEGTSDVHDDTHPGANIAPPDVAPQDVAPQDIVPEAIPSGEAPATEGDTPPASELPDGACGRWSYFFFGDGGGGGGGSTGLVGTKRKPRGESGLPIA